MHSFWPRASGSASGRGAWFGDLPRSKTRMKLTVRPLTPDLWPALEELFGKHGACNGCWCMYGRIGNAYRKRAREKNRTVVRAIVLRGPPPGLLAFNGDVPVGWCQLTPREAVPWLDQIGRSHVCTPVTL